MRKARSSKLTAAKEDEYGVSDLDLHPEKYLPAGFEERFSQTSASRLAAIRSLVNDRVYKVTNNFRNQLLAAVFNAVPRDAKEITEEMMKNIRSALDKACSSILGRRKNKSKAKDWNPEKPKEDYDGGCVFSSDFSYTVLPPATRRGRYPGMSRAPY